MSNSIIKELSLKNFKCHKSIKLALAPLTILAGANATGKSSVIQGILMLAQCHADKSKKALAVDDVRDSQGICASDYLFGEHTTEMLFTFPSTECMKWSIVNARSLFACLCAVAPIRVLRPIAILHRVVVIARTVADCSRNTPL